MADEHVYAKISPNFWIGKTGRQIIANGPSCALVALHLLSNPHINPIGLYYLPMLFIVNETGLKSKEVTKAMDILESKVGFAYYDHETNIVFVSNMAAYQLGDSLKKNDNRIKWVNKLYRTLPVTPLKAKFYKKYRAAYHISSKCAPSEAVKASPLVAPTKPLRSHEHEQELKQEQEQELKQDKDSKATLSPSNVIDDSLFESFWVACRDNWGSSEVGNKKEAKKEFDKVSPTADDIDSWVVAVKNQTNYKRFQEAREGWASPHKHVCRWIKYASWRDEVPAYDNGVSRDASALDS